MNFTNPQEVIKKLALRENDVVVDIGAGTGFYSLAAAKIAHNGHVYAVDIQKDLLLKLKEQARSTAVVNLDVVWGNAEKAEGTTLQAGIADAAVVSNILFQADDKKAVLKEVHRILKVGGKILVVDWSDSYGGIGPAPEQVVSLKAAEELLTSSGFSTKEKFDAGAHHYGIVAAKGIAS